VDGVTNRRDFCRSSNTSPTIVLGTCDTGVVNRTFGNGCTTADPIDACLGLHGHRAQSLCLGLTLNLLKATHVITGAERGAIQSCAARGTR
jgi:hypothetical protein